MGPRVTCAQVLLAAALAFPAQAAIEIAPLAGGGPVDGPAVSAALHEPGGLAVSPGGDVYLAVPHDRRVYRIDAAGSLSVVAGNGLGLDTGAGPLQKSLEPRDVALGPNGELYVLSVCRIFRVSGAALTHVAGSGSCGTDTGEGVPATETRIAPRGLAVDSAGNLLLTSGHKLLRVDALSGRLTTVAGTGSAGSSGDGGPATLAQLRNPLGVALDGAGNLLIADAGNCKVRVLLAASGTLDTLAGAGTCQHGGDGGPASAAGLYPADIAVDAAAIYVADASARRVRRIDGQTGVITTLAGTGVAGDSGDGGPATLATLTEPGYLAASASGVLVADMGSYRVRRIAPGGTIGAYAGRGPEWAGVPARQIAPGLITPACMDYTSAVWLAGERELRRVDPGTGLLGPRVPMPPGAGLPTALACFANRILFATSSNTIYSYDRATGAITWIAGTGETGFSGDDGPATQARFAGIRALALDGLGNIYLVDRGNARVRWIEAATGTVRTLAGTGTNGYSGDGGPAAAAQLNYPASLACGSRDLFISDQLNLRVRAVDYTTRLIRTVAGDGLFGYSGDGGPATSAHVVPYGVAVDVTDSLYIAESTGFVRRVDGLTQVISRYAGSGNGYSGDDGVALDALLGGGLLGLAIGPRQRLVLSELTSGGVRLLYPDDARGDFDGDGRTDLVLRRPPAFPFGSADVRIWSMNGATRVADTALGGLSSSYAIQGANDFTGDGRSDLLVSLCAGDCRFYVAPVAAGSVSGALQEITRSPASLTVGASADFNGDGRPDILWYDTSTRRLRVARMQGAQIVATLTPSPDLHPDAGFRVAGAGDVNGDGRMDIVWHDAATRRTEVWLLDSSLQRTATLVTNPGAGESGWSVAAVGDFGTGPLGVPATTDLLWRNSGSGRLVVWHLDHTGRRTAGLFTTPSEPEAAPTEYTLVAPR